MKVIILALAIGMSPVCHAAGFADKLVSLRPMIEKYLGSDVASKIWGVKEEELLLPAIPKVVNDVTSTEIYERKSKQETVKIDPDKKQQYDIAFVSELIEQTREVKANRNELAKWMGTLNQGATREGIYRAMVLDSYYARLENYDSQLSKSAEAFSIYFMKRFVGKEVTKEKLSKINIYSVKRIVTERSLDVIDVYLSTNREGFYDWYGVFSGEMAKKYPVWKNKLRSNTSARMHKKWAKRVPIQFVKSEIIIKLHKLFNTLQKRN